MKIAIGTDHNGIDKKNMLIGKLIEDGYEVVDVSIDCKEGDDYPLYAFNLGTLVNQNEVDFGILLCGTGIGMSIAANKVKGIRAAHVSNEDEARLARSHNNANVITLSANSNSNENLYNLVKIFLNSEFANEERHIRRNEQIRKYEFGELDV